MANRPLSIIKASAGSGKTYTLAKLFIEQLLFSKDAAGRLTLRGERNYHRHMLAITFTNKATDEMKRRIVNELYLLATDTTASNYYADFAGHLEHNGDKEQAIRQRAATALSDVLMNYSLFNVSTIDAFFQTILRTFARELNRSYDYELQIDSEYAISVTVNNFLLSLGTTRQRVGTTMTEVDRWVREMIAHNMSQGKGWRDVYGGKSLRELCHQLGNETFLQSIGELRQYFMPDKEGAPDFKRISRFKAAVNKQIKEERIAEWADGFVTRFAAALASAGVAEGTAKQRLTSMLDPAGVMAYVTRGKKAGKFLEEDVTADNVTAALKKGTVVNNLDDLVARLSGLRMEVLEMIARQKVLSSLSDDLGSLGLIGVLDRELERFRHETNSIMIADTNELIGKVLESGIEFMYEHIGTTIDHYMIDEFQDTSRKQYSNFRPLLDDSISQASGPVDLIIGDSKQAIYRFRNAEPKLFQSELQDEMSGRCDVSSLDTNYRSLRCVVEFNNALVGRLISPFKESLSATYIGQDVSNPEFIQLVDAKKDERGCGLVRVVSTPFLAVEKSTVTATDAALDMLPAYLLEIHRRRGRWSSIGILVDTNTDGNTIVEAIIKHNDKVRRALGDDAAPYIINVASDESMLLRNSPSVMMVISLLRFIDLTIYHRDDESEEDEQAHDANIANRIKAQRREQSLYTLLHNFINTVEEAHTPAANGGANGDILSRCVNMMRGLSADEFERQMLSLLPNGANEPQTLDNIVEHLIDSFVLRGHNDSDETTFLLALEDVVSQFIESQTGSTIREFLRYWDARSNKLSVGSGAGADAVQVMTIHKSKGLEFDCVVIPFADWRINGKGSQHRETLWVDKRQWLNNGGERLVPVGDDVECVPPLIPVRRSDAESLNDASGGNFLPDILAQARDDTLIDLMNKTYVALTRPREELHLFTFNGEYPGCIDEINFSKEVKVSTLINASLPVVTTDLRDRGLKLRQMDDDDIAPVRDIYDKLRQLLSCPPPVEGKPEQPQLWWTLGEAAIVTAVNTEADNRRELGVNDLRCRPVEVRVLLPKGDTGDNRRNIGLIVHRALGRVNYRADIDRAVGAAAAEIDSLGADAGLTLAGLHTIITDMVCSPPATAAWYHDRRMIEPSEASTWWAEDNVVFNERPIAKRGNEVMIKRPDRIVMRPDGTMIVIDFKTGEVRKAHATQVAEYARLLKEALSPRCVKAYLWYTSPGGGTLLRVL